VAGDGADGLSALATRFYSPADVALAPDGALVIVDWNNHRFRLRQPDGRLRIVAGVGELGPAALDDESATASITRPTSRSTPRGGW
jgi:hypothetical protein